MSEPAEQQEASHEPSCSADGAQNRSGSEATEGQKEDASVRQEQASSEKSQSDEETGMYSGSAPAPGPPYGGRGRGGRGGALLPPFVPGKLFLGGIDAHMTKADIDEYCSQWGEVADSVIMENKGYGFVTFRDPKAAMAFLDARHHMIKDRQVDAKAAVPKAAGGNQQLTRKMFVGGTGDLTDEDFRRHFEQFGTVEDSVVVRKEGLSRGFGFVTFSDEMSVEKCLVVEHFISGRKVELKRAVPKEEMAYRHGHQPYFYPGHPGPYGPPMGAMPMMPPGAYGGVRGGGRGGPHGSGRGYAPPSGFPAYDPYAFAAAYGMPYPGYYPAYAGGWQGPYGSPPAGYGFVPGPGHMQQQQLPHSSQQQLEGEASDAVRGRGRSTAATVQPLGAPMRRPAMAAAAPAVPAAAKPAAAGPPAAGPPGLGASKAASSTPPIVDAAGASDQQA